MLVNGLVEHTDWQWQDMARFRRHLCSRCFYVITFTILLTALVFRHLLLYLMTGPDTAPVSTKFKSLHPDYVQGWYGNRSSMVLGFPRLLHQVFLNYTALPVEWEYVSAVCEGRNPTLQYLYWDQETVEALIATDYPWFLDTYRTYRYPVQRADAARYFILHRYGGVYVDLDTRCRRSFFSLIHEILERSGDISVRSRNYSHDVQCILPQGDNGATVTIHLIICQAQSEFMTHVISSLQYLDHLYLLPYLTVMLSTGPYFATLAYLAFPLKETLRLVAAELEEGFLQGLAGRSWHQADGKLFTYLYYQTSLPIKLLFVTIFVVFLVAILFLVPRGCFRHFLCFAFQLFPLPRQFQR